MSTFGFAGFTRCSGDAFSYDPTANGNSAEGRLAPGLKHSRLARGLDQVIGIVTRMVKPNQARHPLVQVAVTRGELVAEAEQDEEIHLIGVVGIRGMSFWLARPRRRGWQFRCLNYRWHARRRKAPRSVRPIWWHLLA